MLSLFKYNWQVREDWFNWCESLPEEEFHKERIGGMKSIRETLIHVIDCELLWLNSLIDEKIVFERRQLFTQLSEIKEYSTFVQSYTEQLIEQLPSDYENKLIEVQRRDGSILEFTQKKILAHMITHEIHHIGQLSVWAREIQRKPISSDLIIRSFE
ncbi:DinB family protein [Solibacillus isronensis]|uniref:DinB family protein n=1 Tax=Solibacillus isronensis TaxID=412383 RepID=UPI0009A7B6C0|nr:DinB family protein [Solibacillus isronensis]